jgi:hypothetical protein
MQEKHSILVYYYRNVKKYSTLRLLKFILEIQQRFIGGIFILILLNKSTPLVVALYSMYISYFYFSEHNAAQLKRTSLFIVSVTLIQYSMILLQQEIPNGDAKVKLIDFIYDLIVSFVLPKSSNTNPDRSPSKQWPSLFKSLGLSHLSQESLLFDSIPTIIFQITIFYYDFFLLFCAERIETVYLKVKEGFFHIQSDFTGKIMYMIDFKGWKDPTTKFLLSVQSIFIVRILEMYLIVLLVLNMFYDSPVWNLFRMVQIFFAYSNLAFRSICDTHLVRIRMRRVLWVMSIYLWCRVILSTGLNVFRLLNDTKEGWVILLDLKVGEKALLAIEFFLTEYVASLYFDLKFMKLSDKIIQKKLIRSHLVALTMTYNYNEQKLMKFIEGYSERLELEHEINKLNLIIAE